MLASELNAIPDWSVNYSYRPRDDIRRVEKQTKTVKKQTEGQTTSETELTFQIVTNIVENRR